MMGARRSRGRVVIHSGAEIAAIREAARAAAGVRDELVRMIQPGMSTLDVDRMAGMLIRNHGGDSAFFGYRGFPGQICISLNDEVVHGIGRADRIIRAGDLVSVDIGVRLAGGIGDTATTVVVGASGGDGLAEKLIAVTAESLVAGIAAACGGRDLSDIGAAVEGRVKKAGFTVVRDFVGHGCGTELHEPPEVPNFAMPARGLLLQPGMVLAIEPMVNAGSCRVTVDPVDGWTVRTADGSLSAHVEHMVLITEGKAEVLTCPKTR